MMVVPYAWIAVCLVAGVFLIRGQLRVQSTPIHLVVSRKPSATAPKSVNWAEIRAMEKYCYGTHYHRLDGSTKSFGWEPVSEELPSEASPKPLTVTHMSMADFAELRRLTMEGIVRKYGG